MPHFLVDASLPRATADVIRSAGHQATDVRNIGLGSSQDDVIAEYAFEHHLSPITRDGDFGNVRNYPPADYRGIVVIQAPEGAGRAMVLAMVSRFLQERWIVEQLDGHLAIVEPARIRVRPPLSS